MGSFKANMKGAELLRGVPVEVELGPRNQFHYAAANQPMAPIPRPSFVAVNQL
jgi:hypothetical protein